MWLIKSVEAQMYIDFILTQYYTVSTILILIFLVEETKIKSA